LPSREEAIHSPGMNRRSVIALGIVLSLTACGGAASVTATMSIAGLDAGRTALVIKSVERVLMRRLAAAEIKQGISVIALPTGPTSAALTMRLPNSAAATKAREILEQPFHFDVRLEGATTGTGELDTHDWIPTGVEERHLEWVQVLGQAQDGSTSIELFFSKEGRTILADVFRKNEGKNIGLFVRDLLVSKVKVQKEGLAEHVVIGGIPSARIADIFADDVNVGLHVTFTIN
jgi:hypothetical protein